MKIFISWSGTKSQRVAAALRGWLPSVIHVVDPFVSSEDISAGTRWGNDIATTLDASNFGIVCVTRENQASPWLNFEAGALAKSVDRSQVIPLTIDLKPSDVQPPLGQFQATPATEDGLRAVIEAINKALGDDRLADELLRKSFDKWWPDLEDQLGTIETGLPTGARDEQETVATPSVRSDRDLLEEMLDILRAMARVGASPTPVPDWFFDPLRDTSPAGGLSRALAQRALNDVPELERRVLQLRYGSGGEREHTLREIGEILHISALTASELEKRALRRLGFLPPGET